MIITAITEYGKYFRVVTNECKVTILSKSTITDCKLFSGKNISQSDLEKIQNKDLENYYYNKALYLLSKRPRSKKELSDYLYQKLYGKDLDIDLITNNIIKRLESYNYINDLEFAKWWVNSRLRSKNRGPQIIHAELLQKGIESHIIQRITSNIDENNILNICTHLIEKRFKVIKGKNDFERMQKMKRYLLGKGFNWDCINKAISQYPRL